MNECCTLFFFFLNLFETLPHHTAMQVCIIIIACGPCELNAALGSSIVCCVTCERTVLGSGIVLAITWHTKHNKLLYSIVSVSPQTVHVPY